MTDPEIRRDTRSDSRSSSGGATWLIILIVIAGLAIAAFAFGFIKVDQTREAQAPVFDVSTAKIDVGQSEKTVKVPTVDVGTTDTQVTMPTMTIEPAKDPGKEPE